MKNFGFVYIGKHYKGKLNNLVNVQKNLIAKLIKKKTNVYLIELSFSKNPKIKILTKNYKFQNKLYCKKIKFFCKRSFVQFCKKQKLILILWISFRDWRTFAYWIILKKTNSMLVYVNEGKRPMLKSIKKNPTFSLSIIFKYIFNFERIHKILTTVRFFPKIDISLSSYSPMKSYKTPKNNKFKIFDNIKNKIIIKNKFLDNKNKISKKYIVFLDTALYDHPYIINKPQLDRKIFFKKLCKILKFLEKCFNKKVIICAHPKNDLKKVNDDFNGFKVKFYQTEKYVSQAFLVTFFTTTSVWSAIAKSKPVIQFFDKNLNKLWQIRIREVRTILDFSKLNINHNINKKILTKIFKKSISDVKKYDRIKKMHLNSDKNSASQILLNLN
jgi:hypothetical protein